MLVMSVGSAQPVQAFIDPPFLTPEHPIAGEVVSVNIRFGICDAIGELPSAGYPKLTRNGNAIRIVFWSSTDADPILCNVPILTETYAFGAFPPGSYTLQVDRDDFGDLGGGRTETLGVLPFTVAATSSPPAAVPTLSRFGLATLIAALVGLLAWRKRQASLFLIVALTLPLSARAQVADPPQNPTLEVLLTTAPGAPTAKQLVDYYARPTGTSPLSALAATSPLAVQYLLPIRAEGDFLRRLEANPSSARAKLERYLLVTYPVGADLAQVRSVLLADPYIAVASEPLPMEFSSASLTNFSVVDEPQSSGQYGRNDLNIDAAWQLAGGYSLIANIDSGLYTNHPSS